MAPDYGNGANQRAVLAERYNNQIEEFENAGPDVTLNKLGEHVATIQFNESGGLGQIVVVQHEAMELFCPSKEVAFAAWNEEFDPETGFPRSTSPGTPEA